MIVLFVLAVIGFVVGKLAYDSLRESPTGRVLDEIGRRPVLAIAALRPGTVRVVGKAEALSNRMDAPVDARGTRETPRDPPTILVLRGTAETPLLITDYPDVTA